MDQITQSLVRGKNCGTWNQLSDGWRSGIRVHHSGDQNKFDVYKVDWQTGTPSHAKAIDSAANSDLVPGFLRGDETHYSFYASRTILRLNTDPAAAGGEEIISTTADTDGVNYYHPHVVKGVPYIFICAKKKVGEKIRLYRFLISTITDLQTFIFAETSDSYGILAGTPWLLVSLFATNTRQLVDYTNGYEGGSSRLVDTHIKAVGGQQRKRVHFARRSTWVLRLY